MSRARREESSQAGGIFNLQSEFSNELCDLHRIQGRPLVFFFNDTPTTEIYTLSLHDALPISEVGEHGRGHLACVRPGVLPEHILCAQAHPAPGKHVADRLEVNKRRQHNNVHGRLRRAALQDGRGERHALGNGGVHLPVARHHGQPRRPAHVATASRSRSASTPGSLPSSRNSRVAPPPVLMKSILSETPAASTAASRSPPPTMLYAELSPSARATSRVPRAKASIS